MPAVDNPRSEHSRSLGAPTRWADHRDREFGFDIETIRTFTPPTLLSAGVVAPTWPGLVVVGARRALFFPDVLGHGALATAIQFSG
jgi:hypothetical protein